MISIIQIGKDTQKKEKSGKYIFSFTNPDDGLNMYRMNTKEDRTNKRYEKIIGKFTYEPKN